MRKTTVIAMISVVIFAFSTGAWPAPIHQAARTNDTTRLKNLLTENPALADAPDLYGLRPLHYAAMEGNREAVELLLARGALIDAKTTLGQTALHLAQSHNQTDAAALLIQKGADAAAWEWPTIVGPYLGEKTPGVIPQMFAPGNVSTVNWDHGAPSFSADSQEVYWSVVFDDDRGFIVGMKQDEGKWQEHQVPAFSRREYRDVAPVLSADGMKLYFTSSRPVKKGGAIGENNLWLAERTGASWSEPRLLAPDIASGKDARPLFTTDGTLYFGSWREGAKDGSNIYYAKLSQGKYARAERLDAPFNTGNAMPTFIADDGSRLVFESFRAGGKGGSDFWISYRLKNGSWGEAINLGTGINSSANDYLGGFSPDGKYFFFVSDRNGNNDIYWVDAGVIPGPGADGAYCGLEPPGSVPEVFAPGIVSTEECEHGAPAFSPDGREMYWSVFHEKEMRQTILTSSLRPSGWSTPSIVPFADDRYLDGNPVFSRDGRRIYFTSNRPFPHAAEQRELLLWIWFVERTADGWTKPAPLEAPFQKIGLAAAPSFGPDGVLYFVPWKGEDLESYRLYSSRLDNGVFTKPEKLHGLLESTKFVEYPFVSADGSCILFDSSGPNSVGKEDIYVTFRNKDGSWTKALNLGPVVNSPGAERFPYMTPDGKYLFFASDRNGGFDYFWMRADTILELSGCVTRTGE